VSDTFLRVAGSPSGLCTNNLWVGSGTPVSGSISADHNAQDLIGLIVNRSGYDYHLSAGSPAIDAGRDPGSANGISLAPAWEYVHPLSAVARVASATIDVGAYEYHQSP